MAKLTALAKAAKFSGLASTRRSRALLFCLGLINQLDHRRRALRRFVATLLVWLSESPDWLVFRVKILGRECLITARINDFADYQTIFECFGGMYRMPMRPIRHVFDGGGNIGLFSVAAAAHYAATDILIVEPDPENFALLKKNLLCFPNAIKVRAALAAHDGVANFERLSSNGGHLVDVPSSHKSEIIYNVPTRRIKTLLPREWNPSELWLKLDIEGAEYDVFRDMLAADIKPAFVSAEIHDYLRAGGDALVDQLRDAGYSVMVEGFGTHGNVCRQISAYLP